MFQKEYFQNTARREVNAGYEHYLLLLKKFSTLSKSYITYVTCDLSPVLALNLERP